MLDRVDVHCVWVSNKVLSLLPSPLPEIPGGDIPARGIFCDNAIDLVMKFYPKPSDERRTQFIKDAMFDLNKLGIVGMHDAGVFPSEIKLYEKLASDDDWTVRVNAMLECETRNTFCPESAVKIARDDGMLNVRSVKLFGGESLAPSLGRFFANVHRWGPRKLGKRNDRALFRPSNLQRLPPCQCHDADRTRSSVGQSWLPGQHPCHRRLGQSSCN